MPSIKWRQAERGLPPCARCLEEQFQAFASTAPDERVLRLKERQVRGNRQEAANAQVRLAGLYVKSGRVGRRTRAADARLARWSAKVGRNLRKLLRSWAKWKSTCAVPRRLPNGGSALRKSRLEQLTRLKSMHPPGPVDSQSPAPLGILRPCENYWYSLV